MGMYVESTRDQLCSELVFLMLFKQIRAALMGMYSESIGIRLRCELVVTMLFAGLSRTHEDACWIHKDAIAL